MITVFRNTQKVGLLSELEVMQEYVRHGYAVYSPLGVERLDFIARKDRRFVRVQVKAGTSFNDGRELIAFCQKPYTKKDCDIIVIHDAISGKMYFLPVEHVEGMTQIRLRLVPYVYNVKEQKALDGAMYRRFLG